LRIIVITMPNRSRSSIWGSIITIYQSLHQLVDGELIFNLLRIIVISMPTTKSKSSIWCGILIIIDLNLVLTFIPPSPINYNYWM
jgi:type III secretory pathway component EscS